MRTSLRLYCQIRPGFGGLRQRWKTTEMATTKCGGAAVGEFPITPSLPSLIPAPAS